MYKTIEELVTRVDERNSDGTVSELIGVSMHIRLLQTELH